jgi:hypothetical protein
MRSWSRVPADRLQKGPYLQADFFEGNSNRLRHFRLHGSPVEDAHEFELVLWEERIDFGRRANWSTGWSRAVTEDLV